MQKNGNIGAKMTDERRKSKPKKVKKYGEFRVFKRFPVFASLSSCIFVGLFCEPSKMGIAQRNRELKKGSKSWP